MAETVLEVDSVDTALAIFGNCDENIRLLEQAFGVTAICRGTEVKLTGGEEDVERARRALDAMLMLRAGGTPLEEQTVRYCIDVYKRQAPDSALWKALEVAQGADFVRGKPDGLDTPVEEGGKNLSGGQKQRLTIARALAKQPRCV